MTIREILQSATVPSIEAEILLSHILKLSRTTMFTQSEREVDSMQQKLFLECVERRLKGEPVAYITGVKEFYGREFLINQSTLIPRPATEYLVDSVKEFLQKPEDMNVDADTSIVIVTRGLAKIVPEKVLDVGTGSGNIAITLSLECPGIRVEGVDTSQTALEVAKVNVGRHQASVKLTRMDGIEAVKTESVDFLLVSNPPYIPEGTSIMHDVINFEPSSALFAGEEGLDLITPLVQAAKENPHCSGIVLECRSDQVEWIDTILRK